ncbi:MAG TPA: GNAT family N-acetyltransferase [Steroidobacteraceae bacterium]|nr:GNAT family N-acetyltransferase [Steroidobacteraceae bacterium]
MTGNVVVIDSHRVELHEAFLDFVPRVFPSISFRRWNELGGWHPNYCAFVIFEGREIIANASLQRMELVVRGQRVTGWQFGAVGVLPDWRGRGLQRQLMGHVLGQIDQRDLVFLFANDDVLDFYPQFGFRPVTEWLHGIDMHIEPQASALRRLSLDSADDRALLTRLAAISQPVSERFAAINYGGILLWYWTNFHQDHFYYHAGDDAIVVAEEDAEVLRVLDVIAQRPIDLAAYLPHLVSRPTDHVEFGFTPDRYWPGATPFCEYLESPLFVLGDSLLPSGAFKFPVLAQT